MASDYEEIALGARKKVLDLIYKAQTSHIGSNFSCIDILTVLFEQIDLDKDRFVLSKGWVAASLYYFLWRKGRITEEELNSFCQGDSKWIGLAEPIHKDIPIAGGSMGLGLPGAVGIALAKKIKGEDGIVYVLMSDGELDCGTFWESILITNHHKLKNIKILIDRNGLQGMGRKKDILDIPLEECLNGHNYEDIKKGIESDDGIVEFSTVKGKGVSFMENDNLWHYAQIKEDDYIKAMKELCQK